MNSTVCAFHNRSIAATLRTNTILEGAGDPPLFNLRVSLEQGETLFDCKRIVGNWEKRELANAALLVGRFDGPDQRLRSGPDAYG
jgi:hypothetical protein